MKKLLLPALASAMIFMPAQAQTDDPGALTLSVGMKCSEVYQMDSPPADSLKSCAEAGDLIESIANSTEITSKQRNSAVVGGTLLFTGKSLYEGINGTGNACATIRRSDALLKKYINGLTPEHGEFYPKQVELHNKITPKVCG